VTIGGDAPVSIQSMTNTRTADVAATVEQIRALVDAGADLVRVAAATKADTAAMREIVARSPVPVIADVHFRAPRALEAIAAGAAKVRLNPGNITDREEIRRVIDSAAGVGVAIRVGVNEGSILDRRDPQARARQRSQPLDVLMERRLAEYLEPFEAAGFEDLVLSAKSHDAATCIAVNRRLARRWDYPLHLGLTHAGTAETGTIRSAAAIGTLLAEGIGETIRISFAGDPVAEVRAAVELLASLRLRKREGVELIACPTCGRMEMDLWPMVEDVRRALADVRQPLTVAMMGCIVNGPGEAEGADIAICAGKAKADLYRNGKKIRSVPAKSIVRTVIDEVRKLLAEQETRNLR